MVNFKDPAIMLDRLSNNAYTVKQRIRVGKTAARWGRAPPRPPAPTVALVPGAILWETFVYLYVAWSIATRTRGPGRPAQVPGVRLGRTAGRGRGHRRARPVVRPVSCAHRTARHPGAADGTDCAQPARRRPRPARRPAR